MSRYPRLRKVGEWYTLAALTLLTCLLLAGAVEAGARVAKAVRRDGTDPRARLAYYAATGWGDQLWRESSGGFWYKPYTLWRRHPASGRFVNVDTLGMRRTAGADCRPGAYTVFAFGGSTMWGLGAADDATIPAFLQRELSRRLTGPVCVMNLGENGYVSTQEVIELLMRLQGGARPDLVLFYDGVNDVYSTYQNGRAGVHHNLDQYQIRLGGAPLSKRVHYWFINHSQFYEFADNRLARLRNAPRVGPGTSPHAGAARDGLGAETAQAYLANYAAVDALSQRYGFRYAFFLQPVSFFAPKRLTGEEREMVAWHGRGQGPVEPLFSGFVAQVEAGARELRNFRSLTRVLRDTDGMVWADWAHMTPEGNRRIALAMMETLEGRLPAGPVRPSAP